MLRRVVQPTAGLRQAMLQQEPVDTVSVVAEFTGAQIDGKVDAKAFQFEVPADAETVKFFIPPACVTAQAMLSNPAPAFRFFDLDGKPVTSESLAGKVTVLDFWATWCGPCRQSLPELEKVRKQFQANPKVAFYAVSLDQPNVTNDDLRKAFEAMNISMPILRDTERSALAFKFRPIPTTFIIDGKGVVQDFEEGFSPERTQALPAKLEKVLAGGNIYEAALAECRDQVEELRKYAEKTDAPAQNRATALIPRLANRRSRCPKSKSRPAASRLG